jgi:carboxylesterase type B
MHPREDAFNLGADLNCTTAVTNQNSTELLSCFRQLNASDLVMTTIDATMQQIFLHSVEPPSPTGDKSDVVLPDQPLKILKTGKINKVPVIFGTNSAEGQRENTCKNNINM